MECRECSENISAFIDGELESDLKHQMKAHLHTCKDCQNVTSQLRTLNTTLVQAYDTVQIPTNLEERILLSIRQEKKRAKQQFALTAFILILLFSPFVLLSSLVWRFVQIIFAAGSLLGHVESALIQFIPQTFSWSIGLIAVILSVSGLLLVWAMLKGLRYNEVIS